MSKSSCIDCGDALANVKAKRCRQCYDEVRSPQSRIKRILAMPIPATLNCVWPEGCGGPRIVRRLCRYHSKKASYWGIIEHFERVRPPAVFDDRGRVCTKCDEYKPWAAFAETSINSVNGHRAHCRACYNDKRREHLLRETYGITQADFDRMLETQGNRCAICRTDDPRGHGQWHIDHDHVTGDVRGLLCTDCNTGIGSLKDDPDVLVAAAAYVRRNRQLRLVQ